MRIFKNYIFLFFVSLFFLPISIFIGLYITSSSYEEEKAFDKNKHALEALELLINSENNTTKKQWDNDIFKVNSIIRLLYKNKLPFEVSKIWAVSVDPVDGIQEVYNNFDENIKLKPSDYLFEGNDSWNRIFVKNVLGEGFYVTLKKMNNSSIILVAAKNEQLFIDELWYVGKNSLFSIILSLLVFICLALLVRNCLHKSSNQFTETINDIINNREYTVNSLEKYLHPPEIDLIDKVGAMKDNFVDLLCEAKSKNEKLEVVLKRLQNGVIVVSARS